MEGPILVVAAHPDDEVLGAGGTILKNENVHILIMADGAGPVRGYEINRHFRDKWDFNAEAAKMAAAPAWKNAHRAAHLMGAETLQIGDFKDSYFDKIGILDLTKFVEQAIDRVRPATVITHWPGDLSCDHARTGTAVVTACRPKPGHPVKTILFMEVPSNTEWALPTTFQPNYYEGINAGSKADVMEKAYGTEMRKDNHPRGRMPLIHKAETRGSEVGLPAAEAFVVGRIIR